ncbi:MAG: DUF4505 family protein [Planctomycetota bacterium]
MARHYFYEIDRQGVLWHNGTALTDAAFLRTFFARLQSDEHAAFPGYPFVSRCAGEPNYVRAEVTPIVFRSLDADGLLHGNGEVRIRFDATSLRIDPHDRLFHGAPVSGLGFLTPAVTMELAPAIEAVDGGFVFVAGERRVHIARTTDPGPSPH